MVMISSILTFVNLMLQMLRHHAPNGVYRCMEVLESAAKRQAIANELKKIQTFGESYEWNLQPNPDGNIRPFYLNQIVRHLRSGQEEHYYIWDN